MNALRLVRKVAMYQYQERSESRESVGGGKKTKYWCEKTWSESLIDSSRFKDRGPAGSCGDNPGAFTIEPRDLTAERAGLAGFVLSREVLTDGKLSRLDPLPPDPAKLPAEQTAGRARVEGATYYVGRGKLAQPEIGDAKVWLEVLPSPSPISVIARQSGAGFAPYQARAGDALLLVAHGELEARAMFKVAEADNARLTWILRGLGFFLMTLGVWLVLRPIAMLVNVIPFAGSFVSFGAFLLAGCVCLGLSLATIGVAWVFYRPVLGVILLAAAAGALAVALVMMSRARARRKPEAGQST